VIYVVKTKLLKQIECSPANCKKSLSCNAHDEKSCPRQENVLAGVPDGRKYVDIGGDVQAPYLHAGVVPDAGHQEQGVQHTQGK
jgi:hypothetical protein